MTILEKLSSNVGRLARTAKSLGGALVQSPSQKIQAAKLFRTKLPNTAVAELGPAGTALNAAKAKSQAAQVQLFGGGPATPGNIGAQAGIFGVGK